MLTELVPSEDYEKEFVPRLSSFGIPWLIYSFLPVSSQYLHFIYVCVKISLSYKGSYWIRAHPNDLTLI